MDCNIVIFCAVIIMALFLPFATSLKCPPGTYLYIIRHSNLDFCIECPDGTYMSLTDHEQTSCRTCEEIREPELEILISPCNKTHDAVIHCVDGYYRDEARNPRETGQCKKCTECPAFTGQPCSTYRDTVCCWDENYDVVPNNDGVPMCRERPWFCRRGQYFDTIGFYCLPCPENTFMPLDHHIQTQCWECKESKPYRPLHSVIIQPCNRTHAPVIRCEDGFFINPNMGYRDDATGCSPCTDCSTKTDVQYEGRKCDGMEDTVCCPEANMTVVDTSEGPVCTAFSEDCKDGECLQYSPRKKSTLCTSCLVTSDVVESTHIPVSETNIALFERVEQNLVAYHCNCSNNIEQTPQFTAVCFIFGLITGIIPTIICFGLVLCNKTVRHRFIMEIASRDSSLIIFNNVRPRMMEHYKAEFTPALKEDQNVDVYIESPNLRQRHWSSIETQAKKKNVKEKKVAADEVVGSKGQHGLEQCCGDESDLHSKKEAYIHSFSHRCSISLKKWNKKCLPKSFRTNGQVPLIKAVCDLTVRLKVNHTSSDRPCNDPCSELGGSIGDGIKRFGTGLVYQVSKKFTDKNGSCPCRYCVVYPDRAKKCWGEYVIITSAQMVYDDNECRRTSCRLWFDHDGDFFQGPSLQGRYLKMINKAKDLSIMYCITHDADASKKLEKQIARLNALRNKYKGKSESLTRPENNLAVLVSHEHGLSKRISVRKAQAHIDEQMWKWTFQDETCPGSLGSPVCLFEEKQNSAILTTIYNGKNRSSVFDLDFEL